MTLGCMYVLACTWSSPHGYAARQDPITDRSQQMWLKGACLNHMPLRKPRTKGSRLPIVWTPSRPEWAPKVFNQRLLKELGSFSQSEPKHYPPPLHFEPPGKDQTRHN